VKLARSVEIYYLDNATDVALANICVKLYYWRTEMSGMNQNRHDVIRVKSWSFVIAIAMCSVIHGVASGWITLFSIIRVLFWTLYGYKRLFGGWPDVITLWRSGYAFILALWWPLVRIKGAF